MIGDQRPRGKGRGLDWEGWGGPSLASRTLSACLAARVVHSDQRALGFCLGCLCVAATATQASHLVGSSLHKRERPLYDTASLNV